MGRSTSCSSHGRSFFVVFLLLPPLLILLQFRRLLSVCQDGFSVCGPGNKASRLILAAIQRR